MTGLQTIRIDTDRLWADGGAWFVAGLNEYIMHAGTPKSNSIVHATTLVKIRIVVTGTKIRNSPFINAFFKTVRSTLQSLNSHGITEEMLANILVTTYQNMYNVNLIAADITNSRYMGLNRLLDIIAIRAEMPPWMTQDLLSVLRGKIVSSTPLELFWLTATWPLAQGTLSIYVDSKWLTEYVQTCDLETYTFIMQSSAGFVASIENTFIDVPCAIGTLCPNGYLASAIGLATGVTNMQKPLMSTTWKILERHVGYDTYYDRVITFPCVLTGHKGSGKSTSIEYLTALIPKLVIIDSDDFGETAFFKQHGHTLEDHLLKNVKTFDTANIEEIRQTYLTILPEYQAWAAERKKSFTEMGVPYLVFTHTTMEAACWALPAFAIEHVVPPFDVIMHRSRATAPQFQLLLAITYAQMMSDANLITLHDFVSGVWRGVKYLSVD